jgi:hypothetical protein
MTTIGIIYLVFEKRILAGSKSKEDLVVESIAPRVLIGIQVRKMDE